MRARIAATALIAFLAALDPGEVFAAEPGRLYQDHCAVCHGADRLGLTGPALLPENLGRLSKTAAALVIDKGRALTQMRGFGELLSSAQIEALVELIYTPFPIPPRWGEAEIRASRVLYPLATSAAATPRFTADPLNLFVVVEAGDHHVTILDGDRLEPIHRFASRFSLHGGPKFSPDGRFVYLASRDGWVSKFDLYNLGLVAEIRAGINLRNIAVSGDGAFVMAANYLPHTLILLDARDLSLREVIPVGDPGDSSRVSAVYDVPPRRSFVAALKDRPEIWELSYAEAGSGGPLPIRRIPLDEILDDFFFDPGYRHVIGAEREGGGQVIDLEDGRRVASLPLSGLPHLGSGVTWEREGRTVLATPNLREGVVSVIDLETWEMVGTIETLGPGFFLRTHERSPYAWVDVFSSPHPDSVQVIDKQSLAIVRTLTPAPGKTAAHVEFTRDGSRALLSIWDEDGALVVYDSRTLEEVKRIPMRKPVGKYNVWNKIALSAGTSH
jgi:mono/diheme cytochrome c family protein